MIDSSALTRALRDETFQEMCEQIFLNEIARPFDHQRRVIISGASFLFFDPLLNIRELRRRLGLPPTEANNIWWCQKSNNSIFEILEKKNKGDDVFPYMFENRAMRRNRCQKQRQRALTRRDISPISVHDSDSDAESENSSLVEHAKRLKLASNEKFKIKMQSEIREQLAEELKPAIRARLQLEIRRELETTIRAELGPVIRAELEEKSRISILKEVDKNREQNAWEKLRRSAELNTTVDGSLDNIDHICIICHQAPMNRNQMITRCGHIFCTVCIVQWANIKKRCPTCNQTLEFRNSVIRVYPSFQ